MRRMQEKILSAIAADIEKSNLEPVHQAQHANTGRVFAMRDLRTLFELRYEFHPDRCGLFLSGPAIDALELVDAPPHYRVLANGEVAWHSLKYADSDRLDHFFACVVAATGHAPATDLSFVVFVHGSAPPFLVGPFDDRDAAATYIANASGTPEWKSAIVEPVNPATKE